MAHRYTPLECSYFQEFTGQPLDALDLDQSNDYSASTATIRKYLKYHKEDPEKYPTPFRFDKLEAEIPKTEKPYRPNKNKVRDRNKAESELLEFKNHEYSKVVQDNKSLKRGAVNKGKYAPTYKKKEFILNHIHIESLPSLTGGIKGKKNEIIGTVILPDTGSEISVLSAKKFYELGYSDNELDQSHIFQINTATGQDSSLGMICLDVFLKAMNGIFYRIEVYFVVIKQDIDKILIGYNDLKRYASKWDLSDGVDTMILTVLNPDNSLVRRKFSTLSAKEPLPMRAKLSDRWATFYTEHYPNISNNVLNCHQLEWNGELASGLCQYQLESECNIMGIKWPVRAKFTYTNRVNKTTKEEISGVLMPGSNNIPTFTEEELDLLDEQVNSQDPESLFPAFNDIDDQVLEKVSFPILETRQEIENKANNKENKRLSNIPDCKYVPGKYKKKFEALFLEYEDVFAASQFDIGTVNIPPIKINHDPNDPVFETPKRYTPDELLILDDYLEQMLESGIIEKVSTESKFNSNLVLVISSPHESKKVRSSLKDNLSKEDRLAALKKSLRPCLDLRKVNSKLGNPNCTLSLPSLEQLLPDLRNTLASTTDCKKGYFQLDLEEKSRDIFSFMVNGQSYRFCRLAQGFPIKDY